LETRKVYRAKEVPVFRDGQGRDEAVPAERDSWEVQHGGGEVKEHKRTERLTALFTEQELSEYLRMCKERGFRPGTRLRELVEGDVMEWEIIQAERVLL